MRFLNLRPRLHHVESAVRRDAPLDILRRSERLLNLVRGVRDGRERLRAEHLVAHDGILRVVHRSKLRLVHLDRVVETGTRETLEIFAVGVRSEDERRSVGEQAVRLGGEAGHLGVRQVILPRHEAQRAAREVAHERLSHAADNLSVNFVGVASLRVSGVQHKGVLRLHHGLAQHRHGDILVAQTSLAAAQHRALVVLGRPHAGDGRPSLRRGAVAPRASRAEVPLRPRQPLRRERPRHLIHELGRGNHLHDARPDPPEQVLERHLVAKVEVFQLPAQTLQTLSDVPVVGMREHRVKGAKRKCNLRGEVDPVRQPPPELLQVPGLATHDRAVKLGRGNRVSAHELALGDVDAGGRRRHGQIHRARARRRAERGRVHGCDPQVVGAHRRAVHRLAVHTFQLGHATGVEHRGEEDAFVPGANRCVREDVGHVWGDETHHAGWDILLAAHSAGYEHGWDLVRLVLDILEVVDDLDDPRGFHRGDDGPRAHVGHLTQPRVQRAKHL
mmetsp:Transcript_1262/g.3422  ORF Transcript_1262/g.3422 Transcript_1262/m.3422 type:complete len:502 (+) Transcript_1262:135-1640(+)